MDRFVRSQRDWLGELGTPVQAPVQVHVGGMCVWCMCAVSVYGDAGGRQV